MTCEEFRRLRSGSPDDCTIAELSAAIKHVRNCIPCYAWHHQQHQSSKAKYTPEENALMELEAALYNIPLHQKLAQDQEAS